MFDDPMIVYGSGEIRLLGCRCLTATTVWSRGVFPLRLGRLGGIHWTVESMAAWHQIAAPAPLQWNHIEDLNRVMVRSLGR